MTSPLRGMSQRLWAVMLASALALAGMLLSLSLPARPPHAAARSQGTEVILLDRSLAELAPRLRATGKQVLLFGGPDPMHEIARLLKDSHGLTAIHLFSHGDTGRLILDGVVYSTSHLPEDDLRALGRSLAPGGDLLLYGCDLAASGEGRALLARIARLTGADVAASENETGEGGDWRLEAIVGRVAARIVALPEWQGTLWTDERLEGAWYGDTGYPAGSRGPHPKASRSGSGRLQTMGDSTGGRGVTFSVVGLSCCTAQRMEVRRSSSSYAAAVSNDHYFYSNIVVGGTNGATLSKLAYNQVANNSSSARFELALYDTVTRTLTPISPALAVAGSRTQIEVALTPVPMVAGRTYQLRFYGFDCGNSNTCYFDNPIIWTKENEAPSARNDSYTAESDTNVSGNIVSNDRDPEEQMLTVTQVNGASYSPNTDIVLAHGQLRMNANGSFTFRPANGFAGTQTFTYTISDGFGRTDTATVTITAPSADLSLSKTVSDPAPAPGATVSYTLTVRSAATSDVTATGIRVQDSLPAGFSFLRATGAGTYSSTTGIWSVGSLAAGASASLTITGTATGAPGTTVINRAEISASSASDPDSTPNNGEVSEDDFATASFTILDSRLEVTKISWIVADGVNTSDFKAIPGATVRYCILVTNRGSTAVGNVGVVDSLPATLAYVTGSMRSGTSCASATTREDEDAAGTDEANPVGMSIDGATIMGTAPSLAAGDAFAMLLDARIQ